MGAHGPPLRGAGTARRTRASARARPRRHPQRGHRSRSPARRRGRRSRTGSTRSTSLCMNSFASATTASVPGPQSICLAGRRRAPRSGPARSRTSTAMQALDVLAQKRSTPAPPSSVVVAVVAAERRPGRRRRTAGRCRARRRAWSSPPAPVSTSSPSPPAERRCGSSLPVRVSEPWPPTIVLMSGADVVALARRAVVRDAVGAQPEVLAAALVGEAVAAAAADVRVAAVRELSPRPPHGTPSR